MCESHVCHECPVRCNLDVQYVHWWSMGVWFSGMVGSVSVCGLFHSGGGMLLGYEMRL